MIAISPIRVRKFIDELEQNSDIICLVLLQNNQKIVQLCKKPYKIDELRLLFSLSKSFTSLGVGIAHDLGLISFDDFVVSYFPDKLPHTISENLEKLKIRHLLTMSCGIHENTYSELYVQDDWMRAFFAQELVHEPGSHYRYSTHSTYILSAIVERAAKQSFYSFLKKYLLDPMEIEKSSWEYCSQGITAGGMGLSVPLEAIAKFGQLLLDKGCYNDKRIVSAEYINMATSPQILKGSSEKPSRSNSYGYQFHMDKVEGCFSADGAFGQLCYVVPKHNLVLAVASRDSKVNTIINSLWNTILSEKQGDVNDIPFDWILLRELTTNMSFPIPENLPHPTVLLMNGRYKLSENPNELDYIEFSQSDTMNLSLRMLYKHHNDSKFLFRYDKPVRQSVLFIKDINYHMQNCISYAYWRDSRTLKLTVFLTETPYVITCSFTFGERKTCFNFNINVSFTLKSFSSECEIC